MNQLYETTAGTKNCCTICPGLGLMGNRISKQLQCIPIFLKTHASTCENHDHEANQTT